MPVARGEGRGTTPTEEASRGGEVWLLAGALALLLAVRLTALLVNRTDLFFDEAQYWSWSEAPAFGYYSKPPLIAWVIRMATGVCGASEACVRLPSALLHTATAVVIYVVGRRLYDGRVGVWAALGYATLPGVSLSAGIISTDVPLLLFWALALLAWTALLQERSWWPALLLGLALGLGLNAKYAMAYFVLSAAIHVAITPAARPILRDPRLWVALAIGVAGILPNVAWNMQNQFATVAHTADNANLGGRLINPLKMLEFLGAQFGVFGPVLFGALGVIVWRAARRGLPEPDRMLLAFALPVLAIVTVIAFISRAHANWAAVSYVAASVLVTATLVREASWRLLRGSLALHAVLVLAIAVATAQAGRFRLPSGVDPFARTLGWKALADETRSALEAARRAGQPFKAVLTDDRSVTAELLYYMRAEPTPVVAWRGRGRPRDHYELSRPFTPAIGEPVLLVSLRSADVHEIPKAFAHVERVEEREVPAGAGAPRRIVLWRLSGYREAGR